MSCKGWYSKKDVIKDLATATGKTVHDFDEEHVVIGARPPPPRSITDEEQQPQILRLGAGQSILQENIIKPDLAGITKFLRMVDNFNETPSSLNRGKVNNEGANDTNTVILISKLNPNVPEFIPKANNGDSSSSSEVDDNRIREDVNKKDDQGCDLMKNKDNFNGNLNPRKCDVNGKVNEEFENTGEIVYKSHLQSNYTPVELKDMAEKLKTKITEMSKANCIKGKRDRNIAIATLLKLNCQTPDIPEDKPKLIAPDYFQKSLSDHKKVSDEKLINNTTDTDLGPTKPVKLTQNVIIDDKELTLSAEDTSKIDNLKNSQASPQIIESDKSAKSDKKNSPSETNILHEENSNTKVVNESIKKVENWLRSPTKKITSGKEQKGTTVYLGPVTFKRKVTSKPLSPCSIDSEVNVKKKETVSFIPSEYANELSKKYMERNRKIETTKQDLWTKLESELKVKDELIKKKRLQDSQSNSSLNTADSIEIDMITL